MNFNPDNLETTFIEPVTPYNPIENRKYTLTHSDDTKMLFLTVANKYNYEEINQKLRDELLGTWKKHENSYALIFYAYVGEENILNSLVKYKSFKYHMELAIKAVMFGDREFLKKNPDLMNCPVFVKFDSSISSFDNYEFYGFVKDYVLKRP